MDWLAGLYRHIADRTRTFWLANVAIGALVAVGGLLFAVMGSTDAQRSGGLVGLVAGGVIAAFFGVGALLTPRD